jgi:hypothetical protein
MLTTWDGLGAKLIRSWTGVWPATSKNESPELRVASKPPLRDNSPMSTHRTSALPPGVDGVEIKVTLGASNAAARHSASASPRPSAAASGSPSGW